MRSRPALMEEERPPRAKVLCAPLQQTHSQAVLRWPPGRPHTRAVQSRPPGRPHTCMVRGWSTTASNCCRHRVCWAARRWLVAQAAAAAMRTHRPLDARSRVLVQESRAQRRKLRAGACKQKAQTHTRARNSRCAGRRAGCASRALTFACTAAQLKSSPMQQRPAGRAGVPGSQSSWAYGRGRW